MATKRYIVGGPPGSGKSTIVLSLVENIVRGERTAVALELDQWSDSYRAIRGEIRDEQRNKRFHLEWPWQKAVDPLIEHFIGGTEDVIFGDLPGVLGKANSYICDRIAKHADGAIIVGRDPDGIKQWRRFFHDDYGLEIVREIMSVRGVEPLIMEDMRRKVDPYQPMITCLAFELRGMK